MNINEMMMEAQERMSETENRLLEGKKIWSTPAEAYRACSFRDLVFPPQGWSIMPLYHGKGAICIIGDTEGCHIMSEEEYETFDKTWRAYGKKIYGDYWETLLERENEYDHL